jgi:hypothetical protein
MKQQVYHSSVMTMMISGTITVQISSAIMVQQYAMTNDLQTQTQLWLMVANDDVIMTV